jgi:glycosyltransferase involved in cell wall biosynthesis
MNRVETRRHAVDALRTLNSYLPALGLIPKRKSHERKPGITAMVRVMNEPWIIPSLLSLKDFVDEIVVIDSSTDETPKKIKDLQETTDLPIIYEFRDCDIREASQRALDISKYEWLLRWDGDFIAYTSGERNVSRLRELALNLPGSRYFMIIFPIICLDYDLFHVRSDWQPLQREVWLFTYDSRLSYGLWPESGLERMDFPLFFKRLWIDTPFAMHLRSVKDPARLLERNYRSLWMSVRSKNGYTGSLEEFVEEQSEKELGSTSLTEAEERILEEHKRNLQPYGREIMGDYPNILKDYARETLNIEL